MFKTMAVVTIRRPWSNSRNSSQTWKERKKKPQDKRRFKNRKRKMTREGNKSNNKIGIQKTGGKEGETKLLTTFSIPVTYQQTWVTILRTLSPRSRTKSKPFRHLQGKYPIDPGRYGKN